MPDNASVMQAAGYDYALVALSFVIILSTAHTVADIGWRMAVTAEDQTRAPWPWVGGLVHADTAMYRAKKQGGNNHQLFTPTLKTTDFGRRRARSVASVRAPEDARAIAPAQMSGRGLKHP